jgi:hypothetical protein
MYIFFGLLEFCFDNNINKYKQQDSIPFLNGAQWDCSHGYCAKSLFAFAKVVQMAAHFVENVFMDKFP